MAIEPSAFGPRPHKESGESMPNQEKRNPLRVLLVDDEPLVQRTAKIQLESLGHTVTTADDGIDAIVKFGNGDEFDLVLLDLTMPRMNGQQCFAELRRIAPNVRVLLSTGYGESESVSDMIGRGLDGLIRKPYSLATLRAGIEDIACPSSREPH